MVGVVDGDVDDLVRAVDEHGIRDAGPVVAVRVFVQQLVAKRVQVKFVVRLVGEECIDVKGAGNVVDERPARPVAELAQGIDGAIPYVGFELERVLIAHLWESSAEW